MYDESISQAEIDALVRGLQGGSQAPAAPNGSDWLKGLQRPLQEFASHAGRSLSDLVGAPSQATLGDATAMTLESAGRLISGQVLIGRSSIAGPVKAEVYYLIPLPLGLSLITQIYGGVAPSHLDSAAMSALTDGITQLHQVGMTRLGEALATPVHSAPVEFLTNIHAVTELPGMRPDSRVAAVTVDLTAGDAAGRFYLLLPDEVAAALGSTAKVSDSQPQMSQQMGLTAAMAPAVTSAPAPGAPPPQAARQTAAAAQVAYTPAAFPDLAQRPVREEPRNLDILMDVSLQVTVELGRTRKQIRELLSVGPGSVLELERMAGEQVDVLINGKRIAKGEVVVIDEHYGVRITDIISPAERVQQLK